MKELIIVHRQSDNKVSGSLLDKQRNPNATQLTAVSG